MVKKVRVVEKVIKKDKKSKIDIDFTTENEIKQRVLKQFKKPVYLKVKRNIFIAIILRKNKSALLCKVPRGCIEFSVDHNTYFSVDSGTYISNKNVLLAIYLEGCVLPIEHSYIKYDKHRILLKDNKGLPVKNLEGNDNIRRDDIALLPTDDKGNYIKTSDGYIVKKEMDKIKGLEFDSITADAIYNSGLIEKVARGGKVEKIVFYLFVFSIIGLILMGVNCIISYLRV